MYEVKWNGLYIKTEQHVSDAPKILCSYSLNSDIKKLARGKRSRASEKRD